jgi:hypothetical protein
MGKMDFFKRMFGDRGRSPSSALARAQAHAGNNVMLKDVIAQLYHDPDATDAEIARAISTVGAVFVDIDVATVRGQATRYLNMEVERDAVREREKSEGAKNTTTPSSAAPDSLEELTIDDMEKQAIHIVMSAHSGVTLNAKMKMVVIFLFKTFAPFLVLLLTIPESYWVFTHIYAGSFAQDKVLPVLTGVFAVLVDFGYLYLTVLLELNKEALFKRRRAGLEIEQHEIRAVRLQSVLWWVVASMDVLAQFLFLFSATHGSTFFDQRLILALVCVRVFSLFITMFVVSFAGTELMTNVDVVANEQVERADKVSRVLGALGVARQKQMEAKLKLENMVADQEFKRAGESFLKDMYDDARTDAKRLREQMRASKKA